MSEIKEVNWKKNLFFLWLAQLLSQAGFSGVMPFIPIFIREKYHITDDRELGMWIAAFTFCSMLSFCISTPIWGILSDKFGRKIMLLRSYFAAGILFPFMYFLPQLWMLLALRFFCSLFTGTIAASQTLVVTNTPQEHHGFALGLLSSALWSGSLLGFLCGSMIVHSFGFISGFICCCFLYLFSGFMTLLFVRENFTPPEADEKQKAGKKTSLWKEFTPAVLVIMMLFFLMGLARRFDEPYIAILVSMIGGEENTIYHTGIISAGAALGGIFSGIVIGKLSDHFSPTKIAIPSIILAAITMIFQFMASSLFMLGGFRVLHFTAAGGLEPVFQTLLSRAVPLAKRGTYFGLANSLRIFGILCATVISGAVIGLFGVRAVFIGSCVLFLSLIPLLCFAVRKKD